MFKVMLMVMLVKMMTRWQWKCRQATRALSALMMLSSITQFYLSISQNPQKLWDRDQVLRNDIEVLAEEAEKEIRIVWNVTNRLHSYSYKIRLPPKPGPSNFDMLCLKLSDTFWNFQRPQGADIRDSWDAKKVGKTVASTGQGQQGRNIRMTSAFII